MNDSALDNPVLHSLSGVHRAIALVEGRAARYPAEVSPFMAVPLDAAAEDWDALARLAGDDAILLVNPPENVPETWELVRHVAGLQMIAADIPDSADVADSADIPDSADRAQSDWSVQQLGLADADEMLELATATGPGPFARRTGELGFYLGVRDKGKLVAMAGERMRPAGWTEISAVCTDPSYRGRGLGRMLMERVGDGIRSRGERPFLHVVEENVNAIRLYQAMGYTTRRGMTINAYRAR